MPAKIVLRRKKKCRLMFAQSFQAEAPAHLKASVN